MDQYKQLIMDVCEDGGYTVEEEQGAYYIACRGLWDTSILHYKRLATLYPGRYTYPNEQDAWEACLSIVFSALAQGDTDRCTLTVR